MANIQMIHVPYKGGGPQTVSLLSGETQSSIVTMGSFLPYIKSGRVRLLGVTSARRSTILPQVPTIAETLPGYDMSPWIGAFAPAGTPKAIVDRLNAEITKILKRPEFAKQMLDSGVEPWPSTPQEFSVRLKSDFEQLQKIFKIIGGPPP
jgi:tripartite-type tricarboxylate transporter receptor subunit TctC